VCSACVSCTVAIPETRPSPGSSQGTDGGRLTSDYLTLHRKDLVTVPCSFRNLSPTCRRAVVRFVSDRRAEYWLPDSPTLNDLCHNLRNSRLVLNQRQIGAKKLPEFARRVDDESSKKFVAFFSTTRDALPLLAARAASRSFPLHPVLA
jgi:hypothetical protein